jgi:hypothetical protein
MKKFLVIAAAGGALAIGVPAAFAVTDAPQTQTIQQESTPAPQERPDREDCPEKDGQSGGGNGASGSSATPTPGAEL